MTVLVTGATGNIGSELIRLLVDNKHPVRAMARSVDRLAAVPMLEPFAGDFADRERLRVAMDGVDTLVLITPSAPQAAGQASACIAAAGQAGVRKIVRISAIKASPDGPSENTRLHARTEAEIREAGMEHVFLRPNFFMQNMLLVAGALKTGQAFSFANGDARMGLIDARDVALCARQCVLSDAWNGEAFELTGPEAISFGDVAERLTASLGCKIRYQPVLPEAAHDYVLGSGWGAWMAELLRDYGAAYGSGWGDFVTGHVHDITGQPARSFEVFADEVLLPVLGHDPVSSRTG
ncbi:NAD(P)H-binding protein [Roseibium sp. Sym1]|uniref:NAD(P)H-binding protein n=1 Tax=Roseibium sp. Sym1 TaxID=3016006 RepID=UPI0022B325F1|nr:NAD(P)H-binding protein [Roseibium sp. Sym1]